MVETTHIIANMHPIIEVEQVRRIALAYFQSVSASALPPTYLRPPHPCIPHSNPVNTNKEKLTHRSQHRIALPANPQRTSTTLELRLMCAHHATSQSRRIPLSVTQFIDWFGSMDNGGEVKVLGVLDNVEFFGAAAVADLCLCGGVSVKKASEENGWKCEKFGTKGRTKP